MNPAANPVEDAIAHLLQTAKGSSFELEILATERKSTAISFQKRKMDQFAFSETRQLGVRVRDGKNEGVAYTESLSPESLDQLLSEARENARMIRKDWIADLHLASNIPELPGIFNSDLAEVPTAEKIARASELEAAALDFNPAIAGVAYTRYADAAGTFWIANSKGLHASYKQNYCMGYTYCLANDGDAKVMAGEAEAKRSFGDLNTLAIARRAAEKTLARRGAVRPDTGKYTVVFENRAAEDLIGMVSDYFSGKSIDEKTSPLQGKLGKRVLSEALTLVDDPFFTNAHGCRPFDDEGYVSQKTMLVERGILKAFLTNSVLARKLNLAHTASAARSPSSDLKVSTSNLLVQPGAHSAADLLNSSPKVIQITSMQGMAGFRATSGDFSIPVEGHFYENGKASGALKDFLISGNILQLLTAVEAVGNDALLPIGTIVCPSLLIRDLNVIGKS